MRSLTKERAACQKYDLVRQQGGLAAGLPDGLAFLACPVCGHLVQTRQRDSCACGNLFVDHKGERVVVRTQAELDVDVLIPKRR